MKVHGNMDKTHWDSSWLRLPGYTFSRLVSVWTTMFCVCHTTQTQKRVCLHSIHFL